LNSKLTTRDLAYMAMAVALIAICSWISIPTTVPFTMQTFAVCLVSALLGTRRGFLAVACYLLLGAVGAPVFAGFKGGLGALLGVTGGYLVGFLFTALIAGAGAELSGRKLAVTLGAMAAGVLLCYVFGTALAWCVLPYLLPDAVKITLAAVLARRLYPLIDRKGRTE
jgi:biotin transport system substrate-specific component